MLLFQTDSILKKIAEKRGMTLEQAKQIVNKFLPAIAESDQKKADFINERLKLVCDAFNNKAKPDALTDFERAFLDYLRHFSVAGSDGKEQPLKLSSLKVSTYWGGGFEALDKVTIRANNSTNIPPFVYYNTKNKQIIFIKPEEKSNKSGEGGF